MSLHKLSFLTARIATTAVLLAVVGSCSDGAGGKSVSRLQVVLDYSPTLSDADALLYLASNPAVELLAVTLPGTGEADCEPGTRITRSLLTVAGTGDIPIGCGRNTPLIGDRDWPDEWRAASNSLGDGLLPTVAAEPVVDAEQLLADTLRAATSPVTLVAVAPLTNLAVVLGDHPELAQHVARVVIMGGAVTVPGNVEESPAAEWNIYIDPEAARRVIATGIPITFVPLDATNYVAWNDRLLARLDALDSEAAQAVHDLAIARESLDGFYLWDELAAMVSAEPTLVTTESTRIRVDDDGALVRDPAGFAVNVAVSADTSAAMAQFLTGLNRGTAPATASLTAAELEYMVTIGGADSDAGASIGRVFGGVNASGVDQRTQAETIINAFLDAIGALANDLRDVAPPSSLAKAHDGYVASLDKVVSRRSDALTLIAASNGTTVDEIMTEVQQSNITDDFKVVEAACRVLVDYSFVHDGPRPCSFGG